MPYIAEVKGSSGILANTVAMIIFDDCPHPFPVAMFTSLAESCIEKRKKAAQGEVSPSPYQWRRMERPGPNSDVSRRGLGLTAMCQGEAWA